MIDVNIDPILISLGPVAIRYYGLIFVLGFIVALYILKRAVRRSKIEMQEVQVYDLIFYLLLGVIIGARIFHTIFWNFSYYFNDPLKILYIWEGGLSFHGGLVGAVVVAYFFAKKRNLSFWRLADIIVLPAIFVLALGRIANFINQEILGKITDVSWCVRFLRADPGNCRHPVQLYASAGRFLLFFILLKIKESYKDGFVFWNFVTLLGVGRFFMDFLREDVVYLWLSSGQWLSLVMFLVGIYVLIKYYKDDLKSVFSKEKAGDS